MGKQKVYCVNATDLDDRTMIKIMANENMENWETNTSVINETILTVYEFLMGPGVRKRERTGAVAEIKTFLGLSPLVTGAKLLPGPPPAVGSGWSEESVRLALATIRDDGVDREAAVLVQGRESMK